jgi:hypothetical protein
LRILVQEAASNKDDKNLDASAALRSLWCALNGDDDSDAKEDVSRESAEENTTVGPGPQTVPEHAKHRDHDEDDSQAKAGLDKNPAPSLTATCGDATSIGVLADIRRTDQVEANLEEQETIIYDTERVALPIISPTGSRTGSVALPFDMSLVEHVSLNFTAAADRWQNRKSGIPWNMK